MGYMGYMGYGYISFMGNMGYTSYMCKVGHLVYLGHSDSIMIYELYSVLVSNGTLETYWS